jgi:hypothetical protein
MALVRPEAADAVAQEVKSRYAAQFPELADQAPVEVCSSDDGAGLLSVPEDDHAG